MSEEIVDCHYCEYAVCIDDKSDVDCYVDDYAYFDHHVTDSKEAENCLFLNFVIIFQNFERRNRMSRDEMKLELKRLISNLRSMADEWEKLYNEMDELSEDEFDAKSEHIQDIYCEYGIELF